MAITNAKQRLDWRAIIYRIVVILLGGALLGGPGGVYDVIGPWKLAYGITPTYAPELHRWHNADIAAFVTIIIVGGMAATLRRPRSHPLLVQFILLAVMILAIAVGSEALVPCLIVGVVLSVSYPAPRALLSFGRSGPIERPLLAVAIATLPFLIANGWTNLQLALHDHSQHALLGHWRGSVALAIILALGGLLAATSRPGAIMLSRTLTIAYAYLGVSALTIPMHDGSWGLGGGSFALVAAVAFLGATLLPQRRPVRPEITLDATAVSNS